MEALTNSLTDISLLVILLLVLAAIIAGYIDTLVGGGGLIIIPALLVAGVPPIMALGTNKLQACAGTGTASIKLLKAKRINISTVKWLMAYAFVGALLGAVVVQYVDTKALEYLIPVVIGVILIYFVVAPKPVDKQSEPKLSQRHYGASAVSGIGFYDGMFGPATGSFFVLSAISLRGQTIIEATMNAKALNFATNVASLLVFLWFGNVAIVLGAVMMLGQFIGASLGARALTKIDPSLLRSLVVAMCIVMLLVWLKGH